MERIYQDKDIVVCVKPVGLDSEAEVPAALKEALGGEIFPIHRLDKNVAVSWFTPGQSRQPLPFPKQCRKVPW